MNSTAGLRGATVVLDDRPILRAFDLEITPGVTVVRGPNGAGKTTLLRALAGLVPLAAGTREVPEASLFIGQRPQLLRGLSARDNLRFLAAFRGVPKDGVGPALAVWGLDARTAARPVETLSAGQRRRAALARIDVERGDLVLLDEPFGDLDEDGGAHLLRAIRVLAGERRRIVIATHGRPQLDDFANEVVRLA
ncbi:MAG TPA: ATP-binding cassette domain-containing protein [Candidatus Limnocylindria bacterium]|nr:ATP-binding cassette domain-containing protein [Candidatus Limnocylindria bacterium]